jgi:hypothetical protein
MSGSRVRETPLLAKRGAGVQRSGTGVTPREPALMLSGSRKGENAIVK